MLEAANQHKANITFCVSKEDHYMGELKDLGLDDSGEDVNVGFFASPKVRYAMTPTEDFSAEVLNAFVEDVVRGRVKRVLKSEPAPARNDGPVVRVVGKTFDSLVTKSEKDVLIEFFAPWCVHCRKLEPIYRQLAQRLSSRGVVVAKIDATANDFPEDYEVSAFPTIYLRRETSVATLYSGDLSLQSLTQFVDRSRDEL